MLDFIARIKDHTTQPPGSMPTRAPKAVLIATLLLVVGVLTFCGKSAQVPSVQQRSQQLVLTDVNKAQLEEYIRLLLEAQKKREGQNVLEPSVENPHERRAGHGTASAAPPAVDRALEEARLEREARKASNIVLSLPHRPLQRPGEEPKTAASTPERKTEPVPPTPAAGEHTLYEGTLIEAALANRLDGTFTGPVNCIVTAPVYSRDKDLLIPAGARLLGSAHRVSAFGQERLAISFHRLLMPNRWSLKLADEIALNAIGEAGLKDKTDQHLFRLLAASAAVGVLGGVAIAGTNYGAYTSGGDRLTQSTIGAATGSVSRILEQFVNVLPKVIIREGHRVRVYLGRDIFLPTYKESK